MCHYTYVWISISIYNIQTCCCSFAFLMSGLKHCYGLRSNSVRLRSNCQWFHNVSPYVSVDCCFYCVVCVFLLMNASVRLSVQIHWVGTIRDMICEFGACSLSSYVCRRSCGHCSVVTNVWFASRQC